MPDNFCHLHVHDEYSLLDGLGTAQQYLDYAKRIGQQYVAITNHASIDGTIKAQKVSEAIGGVKLIVGAELYIVPDVSVKEKGERRKHILVLVKNDNGWFNLLQMLTVANIDGFYHRPRISPEILLKHADGLIISTACASSFITEGWGIKLFEQLNDIMKDDLYLEVMPHLLKDQKDINRLCNKVSWKYGNKMIVTNDCHYVYADDSKAHEVLLCVQRKANWNDANRWKFDVTDLYLKTADEMFKAFREQNVLTNRQVYTAMENTLEIAEKCKDFSIAKRKVSLPNVDVIVGRRRVSDEMTLRKLCELGMKEKILNNTSKTDTYKS